VEQEIALEQVQEQEELYKVTVWSRRAATRYGFPSVRYGSKHRATCIVAANNHVPYKVEKLVGNLEDVTQEFDKSISSVEE